AEALPDGGQLQHSVSQRGSPRQARLPALELRAEVGVELASELAHRALDERREAREGEVPRRERSPQLLPIERRQQVIFPAHGGRRAHVGVATFASDTRLERELVLAG